MVILRPTRKLFSQLRAASADVSSSDTALGDWYVNRIVVRRQPMLLLVSSTSFLPILVPARDVRALPDRLADLVVRRLWRLGVDWKVMDAESVAMASVHIGPTLDRSVLGVMGDLARSVPHFLDAQAYDEIALERAEDLLAETPCLTSRSFDRVIVPKRKAPEFLHAKWLAERHT